MPLRVQIDLGGEKFFSFAKNKLRDLKAFMAKTSLKVMSKHFYVSENESIWIKTTRLRPDLWMDWIRITAGAAGSIILQTNAHEYSVIRWDGSKVASFDSTGHPWSGYALQEAIGTDILLVARTGAETGTAYVVNAEDFSIAAGPVDFSANALTSFTFRQPPLGDGVTPPRQWVAGFEFGSSTSLTGSVFGYVDQDLTNLTTTSITPATSSGSGVVSSFNWNGGDGSAAVIDLGRDIAPVDEYQFARVDVATGVVTKVVMAGSNSGVAAESVFPVCTNSTLLLRTYGDSSGAYVEARSLADGSLLGRALLTSSVDATNLTWQVLRCDESRALAIFGEGFTPTSYLGFVVTLATMTAVDITEKLTAGLTLLQLGNTSLSRAIILDAAITGVIVDPPESGGGGGDGGGGGRD